MVCWSFLALNRKMSFYAISFNDLEIAIELGKFAKIPLVSELFLQFHTSLGYILEKTPGEVERENLTVFLPVTLSEFM